MSPLIIALSPGQTVRGRRGAEPCTYISSFWHTLFSHFNVSAIMMQRTIQGFRALWHRLVVSSLPPTPPHPHLVVAHKVNISSGFWVTISGPKAGGVSEDEPDAVEAQSVTTKLQQAPPCRMVWAASKDPLPSWSTCGETLGPSPLCSSSWRTSFLHWRELSLRFIRRSTKVSYCTVTLQEVFRIAR